MGAGFWRVRVFVDITQLLRRGRIISLGENKEHRVFFKYERLPNLCYWCGYLTHSDRNCEMWLDSEGTLTVEQQTYGSWIRALAFSKAQRNVITVPGFYKKKRPPPLRQPLRLKQRRQARWQNQTCHHTPVW